LDYLALVSLASTFFSLLTGLVSLLLGAAGAVTVTVDVAGVFGASAAMADMANKAMVIATSCFMISPLGYTYFYLRIYITPWQTD